MDIETVKKGLPEIVKILDEELTGCKKFVFKKFCEEVNLMFSLQQAEINSLNDKIKELEKAAKAKPEIKTR